MASPYEQAVAAMGLSPQEQYLYTHHLNNLYGPGKVEHPDGGVSTVSQAVVSGPGSLYYNIPTVWDGKQLPIDEARQKASQVGWDKFPAYATPEQADLRYEAMHDFINQDTEAWMATHR
jgi:hypothetical protein